MEQIRKICKENAAFLIGWLLVLVAAIVALVVVPKAELHLALNRYHSPALDWFFFHYTHFCNWPMYVLMALPLVCRRPMWTAVFAASQALSALVAHLLKWLWNMPRPKSFFEDLMDSQPALYDAWQQTIVEAVNLHSWHSFPSGHTTAFFAFFATLAFLYSTEKNVPGKQEFGLLCLILALLGGYSRIYLSQHFLLDVTTGMVLGVVSTVVIFYIFLKKNAKLFAQFNFFH